MQTFKYKAISKDGAEVSGVMEAFDEFAAVARIKESCSVVTQITQVREKSRMQQDVTLSNIDEKALAVMCSQFSIILGAGLPVVRAVELIAQQTADRTLRKILGETAEDVAAGFGLARSLQNKGKNLPITFIETIRSGEESGTLDVAFGRLRDYYDRSSKLRGKVKATMIYPLFTLCVAVAVVIIIMVVAVPAFTSSFASMGVELPGVTRALIAVSGFFSKFWALLVMLIAGSILFYKLYGRTERGRISQSRFRLKIPLLGRIVLLRTASQFARTMSTLLTAGLPLLHAVKVTAKVLEDEWIGSELSKQVPKLEEGRTLNSCLRAMGIFPDLLVEMTGVGEETGELEGTLDTVAAYYDNEVELTSRKALSLLEPVVICCLAGIVGFILLSVYLPMFSLYGSI